MDMMLNDVAPAPLDLSFTEQGITDRLLYRDGLMLVIDKPAGIAVHQGPRGGLNL